MSSVTHFAQLRDSRTAYSIYGDGPPILLIHGAEATRSSFDALAERLAHSMTVCSYDQRQCGDTESSTDPASLLDLVDDAAQLAVELKLEKLTVLGTSFGGRLAQGLAIRHPELVDRLVLCNTWPLNVALEAINLAGLAKLQALRHALPDTARALAEAYYGRDHVDRHPELVTRFAQRAGAGPGLRTTLARSTQPLPPEGITVPTLLIVGTADQVVPPRQMRSMHQQIAGSTLVEIEGAHHAITVERPVEVARAIESFVVGEPL